MLKEVRLLRLCLIVMRSYYYFFKTNCNLCKLYISYLHIHKNLTYKFTPLEDHSFSCYATFGNVSLLSNHYIDKNFTFRHSPVCNF